MYFSILVASLGFICFFIWYLASDTASSRRVAGLGAIIASLLTCGIALYPLNQTIKLGLDLQGGTEFLIEVQGNPNAQALDQAASVIQKRLDVYGTSELSIQPEGNNRLKVQIPGLKSTMVDSVRQQISKVAKLELRLVPANQQEILMAAAKNNGHLPFQYAQDYEILQEVEKDAKGADVKSQIVVERQVQMSGKHVSRAWYTFGQIGQAQVDFQLDSVGTQIMAVEKISAIDPASISRSTMYTAT